MAKVFLVLCGCLGATAVILGALSAHGLRDRLEPELLSAFRTGVEYQFYHTLALMGVAILLQHAAGNAWLQASGWLFLSGTILFSGSLYALAGLGWKWLGPVTPIGGLCLIAGWSCLVLASFRQG